MNTDFIKIMAPAIVVALGLAACTIYEGAPGGQVSVVPGYDYDDGANLNADRSDNPTMSASPDVVPNGAPAENPR